VSEQLDSRVGLNGFFFFFFNACAGMKVDRDEDIFGW
jgi:hypothetical protein